MKRTIALLLCMLLLLCATACGHDDSGTENTPETQQAVDYAAVIHAEINPSINIYIDFFGKVLRIEAANDDAQDVISEIPTENAHYTSVIRAFVSVANKKGYIRGDAKIEIGIRDIQDPSLNEDEILDESSDAAKDAADEWHLSINVIIVYRGDRDTSADTDGGEPDTDAVTTAETEPITTAPESTAPSTETAPTTEPHVHHFSDATCTEAARCACGETQGTALGHRWEEATCQRSKTCSVCGAVEGAKGDHRFENGKCIYCGMEQFLNPKLHLKMGVEYLGNLRVQDDMVVGSAFQLDAPNDEACCLTERMFVSERDENSGAPVWYQGNSYYSYGGAQSPYYVMLTDTEIRVLGSMFEGGDPDALSMRLALQYDGRLEVIESTHWAYPVGLILTSDFSELFD